MFLVIVGLQLKVEQEYDQNQILNVITSKTITLDTSFYREDERRNLQTSPSGEGGNSPTDQPADPVTDQPTDPVDQSPSDKTGESGTKDPTTEEPEVNQNEGKNNGRPNPPTENADKNPEKNIDLSFDDINELSLIDDWANGVLLSTAYANQGKEFLNQNFMVGDPIIWVNLRRVQEYDNEDSDTKDVLPNYIAGTNYYPTESLGDEIDGSDVYLEDGTNIPFYSENSDDTPSGISGYIFGYPSNSSIGLAKTYLADYNLMKPNWVAINIMWAYYNRNNNYLVLVKVFFSKTPAGQVFGTYSSGAVEEYYSSGLDRFRAFLEFIFLLCISYVLYKNVKGVTLTYILLYRNFLNSQTDDLKNSNIIYRLLDFNRKLYNMTSTCLFIAFVVFKVAIFFIRTLFYVILALYKYSMKSIYNLLNLVIVSLLIVAIDIWILIVTADKIVLTSTGDSESGNLHKDLFIQTEYLYDYK